MYKSVIQSPDVFPVNNIELKSVVNSTPSFFDNNKVLPLKVLPVTNLSVRPVILYGANPLFPTICNVISAFDVVADCVTLPPVLNVSVIPVTLNVSPLVFVKVIMSVTSFYVPPVT